MEKGRQTLTWEDVCADPSLRDLPFKIELNRFNQIVMAPANSRHGLLQSKICRLLGRLLKGGEPIVELPVETADNVKVPDIAWASRALVKAHTGDFSWPVAPEICVEVLSPANTTEEIDAKRALYFERGAREMWVCDFDGAMSFFDSAGRLEQSILCPKFPARIKI